MSKKLGMGKGRHHEAVTHEKVYSETVAHKHVPGRAYTHDDPTVKLITMIGGGFFNEPKYYDTNRPTVDFYRELREKGCISSVITDAMGLSEQAREVIETAHKVAQGPNPEDLLVIAAWARDTKKGLKLRYTPQIMLALAAANEKTKPFVPVYSTAIIQRADEIRSVFAAFRHLFHTKDTGTGLYKGTIPHSLRKALALAFAEEGLYGLIKYNTDDRPTFGDVLLMLRGSDIGKYLEKRIGKSRQHWPVSKSMFEYLVNGKVGEDAPKMLKLREQFFKLKKVEEVTPKLLEGAGLTWENVISHFGSTKEAWEMCIPLMAEMALVRNLRNFEKVSISKDAWDKVHAKCTSIMDTEQLPFRFFSAEKQVGSTNAKSVTDAMLDNACMNVPDLPGVTVIFTDNSGSATGCAVSGKSKMRVADAGNTLGAIIAKRFGRRAMMGVFGDCLIWVPFSPSDSCMAIKKYIDQCAQSGDRGKLKALTVMSGKYDILTGSSGRYGGGVGGGTETGLWCGIHDLTERKVHVDRIIICSDFCCYTKGDAVNCGHDMTRCFGEGGDKATIQSMIEKYRKKVNPNCWVHSIDLQGYGQAQIKSGSKKAQLLSGWSEQVFTLIRAVELGDEQVQQVQGEPVEVPTIELLRKMYKRS